MQIIVTHDMADFDGLAAGVAAQKLHPGSRIVLGQQIGREVRSFLALHKDRFPTIRVTAVDQAAVTRLIVVDVRRKSRLSSYASVIERAERGEVDVCIYDHHPAAEDDLHGSVQVVEPVGSATTLLVELIRARRIEVDPVDATLYALGIHADTGSLTYAGSTARDAAALSWLIDRGADPLLIARYLRPAFSPSQRRALRLLLEVTQVSELGGLDVGFGLVQLARVVDGVSEVTTEAANLFGYAALFAVFAFGRPPTQKLQLVARSRSSLIDVGALLGKLGGGGHASAASAALKDRNPRELLETLRGELSAHPPEPQRVRDLMSSPVHSVPPETPLASLVESLRRWRHLGAPVVKAGQLIGIISHRDLERARAEDRMDLPVSSCMTHELVTTTPEASLEQALALMERHDVGRLPVLVQGRLVGILSRADVLRVLYAGRSPE